MKKLCAFPTDPIKVYHKKGEIKPGYYNPCDYFDEVHLITFSNDDIGPKKVEIIAGRARLFIHPVGRINIFCLFTLMRRLLEVLKEIKPQAIRAYDPSIRGLFAAYCGKRLSIPTVVSVHMDFDEERKHRKNPTLIFRKIIERYVFKNVAKVICVTEHVENYARRYGAKDPAVIYNRIYSNGFGRNRVIVDKGKTNILSVGRLSRHKRPDCLIKAMVDIDAKLCLIGDGKMYGRLVRLAERLNIKDRVDFVRSVPYSVIHEYYNSADIFAIATEYEGFCTPLLEAMHSGLPIVASNTLAIKEVVDGAGILVKNDAGSFKNAFIKLIKDKESKKELSEKSHKRALSFEGNKPEQKEADVYRGILEKR